MNLQAKDDRSRLINIPNDQLYDAGKYWIWIIDERNDRYEVFKKNEWRVLHGWYEDIACYINRDTENVFERGGDGVAVLGYHAELAGKRYFALRPGYRINENEDGCLVFQKKMEGEG